MAANPSIEDSEMTQDKAAPSAAEILRAAIDEYLTPGLASSGVMLSCGNAYRILDALSASPPSPPAVWSGEDSLSQSQPCGDGALSPSSHVHPSLLPCAFCGSAEPPTVTDFGITCRACHTQVIGAGNADDVAAWNRRPAPAASQALPDQMATKEWLRRRNEALRAAPARSTDVSDEGPGITSENLPSPLPRLGDGG